MRLPRNLAFGSGGIEACRQWLLEQRAASVLVVTAAPLAHLAAPLVDGLRHAGVEVTVWQGVQKEPEAADVRSALEAAREGGARAVVGFGGGSVMDVAKLVAALLDARQSLQDVFGIDQLGGRATSLACMPTTAGTGSEVSPIAIVRDERDGLKKGVISPHLVPDAAFVDPALTIGMPPAVTAATGIDALTHCIEAYANRRAHPLVDTWALEGIRLIARSLPRAVARGDDLRARSDVALGSLLGGMCLGPVNTAAVHALAYPLGSEFDVAHGVSNAVLLAHVLEFNLPAAPERYAQVARALGVQDGGSEIEVAAAGVARIRQLNQACGIPERMSLLGVPEAAIGRMVTSAMTVQRLLAQNPREVTAADAEQIYRRAW